MNRDDIVAVALESGFERNSLGWSFTSGRLDYHLERFAALVAAAEREACMEQIGILVEAEREACAKTCEGQPTQQRIDVRDQCAAAIRARGEK